MDGAYRLGLASVSFRGLESREILEWMCGTGLSVIEWGSDVHAPVQDEAKLDRLAELQDEYGIVCSSYGTYFRLGETPNARLHDYIRAARRLGTDVLRVWCGDKSGGDMTEAERETLIAVCREAAEIAEHSGVTLCTEWHGRTFTERPEDAMALMEAVSSPCFRTYWQPFQWLSPEENLRIARMIAPWAVHLHVFNWRGREKLSLGDAIGEWRRYLSVFPGPRTLLLEFMPDGSPASLAAEAAALRAAAGIVPADFVQS